jgi:hypothetical protein
MKSQQSFDNMLEQTRLARHAIRKAFEATRDYDKASVEEQARDLQMLIIRFAEKAARGDKRI